MTVEGIDVSAYQSSTPSLAGLGFVFVRASIGTSPDARYPAHAADVQDHSLVLGGYHFWQAADPAAQVAAFLGQARGADLLAIDLEGPDSAGATAQGQVRNMIDRLHSAGRLVGLYHSDSGYPDLGQDWSWVARWTATPPTRPWDFWQYQGSPLDRDRWHGDLGSLAALAQGVKGGTDGVTPTRIKGEDWRPSGAHLSGAVFAAPATSALRLATLTTPVRSILELRGNDGGSWRLVEFPALGTIAGGALGYIRFRDATGATADWLPVTPGGDPAVGLPLQLYVAGRSIGTDPAVVAAAVKSEHDRVIAAAIAAVEHI